MFNPAFLVKENTMHLKLGIVDGPKLLLSHARAAGALSYIAKLLHRSKGWPVANPRLYSPA